MPKTVNLSDVRNAIRNVPDFPHQGIQFKDLTTVFSEPGLLEYLADKFFTYYETRGITKVAGIESRGFILGSILASRLGVGFVPIRKAGKLPYTTHRVDYSLEYGAASLEVHTDAFTADDVVLLHDDLLATGGSARAALDLVGRFGINRVYANFIVELDFLDGRKLLTPAADIYSLIHF